MIMSDRVVLQRGFVVKSPPNHQHRWHKRLCTLTLEPVGDIERFMKKYHKDYNKESIVALNSLSRHLVFSYYKDEDDENEEKAIKKFIISSLRRVIDYPSGANNYTYIIKLLLGDIYNNREILLCFEDKGEQQNWFRSFDTSMQSSLPE